MYIVLWIFDYHIFKAKLALLGMGIHYYNRKLGNHCNKFINYFI